MELSTEDMLALRRCMRDVVAFTALPALWRDYSPQAIAESFSDALLSTLHLSLVYICVHTIDKPIEVVRSPQQLYRDKQASDIGTRLNVWNSSDSSPIQYVANPVSTGMLHIATMPIGHEHSGNIVIIGMESPNYLTENDLVVLRVAANQAAVALHQAQLLENLKAANAQKDILLAQEQRARREAEEATQARNEFLSVASHELRTPVTSLRGFVQLLLRQLNKHGTVDLNRLRQALETIDQQSIKLTHLVNQLLDLSRIESGRLVIELYCAPKIGHKIG